MKLGSTIIFIFVFAWIIQFILTYFQMRRYNNRLREMRKEGKIVSTGMSGSMYKRRTYGVLVVDENERIVHAEQLSGWTVFAGLKPVKELEGMTTQQLMDDSIKLSISPKMRNAFQNAVKEIEKAKQKEEQKIETA